MKMIGPVLRDLVGVAGVVTVAIGVGMIHVAAGVIVAGAAMVAGALLAARAR